MYIIREEKIVVCGIARGVGERCRGAPFRDGPSVNPRSCSQRKKVFIGSAEHHLAAKPTRPPRNTPTPPPRLTRNIVCSQCAVNLLSQTCTPRLHCAWQFGSQSRTHAYQYFMGAPHPAPLKAPPDRERLCNDMVNTGVTAALIGGFALSNLQLQAVESDSPWSTTIVYILSCLAVHASTCAALVSAILYRVINQMDDQSVRSWGERNALLLSLPLMKFVMGCVSYIASVLLISFRDLEGITYAQIICLAIGIGSMSSVVLTGWIVARDSPVQPVPGNGVSTALAPAPAGRAKPMAV